MPENLNSTRKGRLAEDMAARYLVSKGHRILERNFLKKYGEIDIISENEGILFFVEVKALYVDSSVTRGTDYFRPEENLTPAKMHKLRRVISVYLSGAEDRKFNVLLLAIEIERKSKMARIRETQIF